MDAYLSAEAGKFLSEDWKEGLRDVIRSAAAREQTSRAELVRRTSEQIVRRVSEQVRGAMVALE